MGFTPKQLSTLLARRKRTKSTKVTDRSTATQHATSSRGKDVEGVKVIRTLKESLGEDEVDVEPEPHELSESIWLEVESRVWSETDLRDDSRPGRRVGEEEADGTPKKANAKNEYSDDGRVPITKEERAK